MFHWFKYYMWIICFKDSDVLCIKYYRKTLSVKLLSKKSHLELFAHNSYARDILFLICSLLCTINYSCKLHTWLKIDYVISMWTCYLYMRVIRFSGNKAPSYFLLIIIVGILLNDTNNVVILVWGISLAVNTIIKFLIIFKCQTRNAISLLQHYFTYCINHGLLY